MAVLGAETVAELALRGAAGPGLRQAAERVAAATAEERRAMLIDLRAERAATEYELQKAQAIVAVLDVMLDALERASASA